MKDVSMLNDVEKQVLKEFYIKKLDSLREHMVQVQNDIKEIEDRLKSFGVTDLFVSGAGAMVRGVIEGLSYAAYDNNWTVAKKAEFILKMDEELLTARDIAERINDIEGGHFTQYRLGDLSDKISSTLKQKVDKKETFTRINKTGAYKYGLLDWIGDNGKIPRKYLYKNEAQQVALSGK